MKRFVLGFGLIALLLSSCSKEEQEAAPKNLQHPYQLTEDSYQAKIVQMETLFHQYGFVNDLEDPYDYNDPKNRKAIEELDLKELKLFLEEFSSEEGLKNLDEAGSIEKSKQYAREHNATNTKGIITM
ncbi:hypothetical protein [Myroides sp. DF42-4-2]|uniref:hypothetical protein n=1 Tax=unclassified Myroides TaxID=2642485 RepID=UPI00257868DD|nr:hypothetical protein [Myroides sp. DF42-4-2]MDM1407545.1 hypothetical protein [Myroides sp. DF42-4-2]